MAIATISNLDSMGTVRTSLNNNFSQVELSANKTNTVTSTASTVKYTTEKAIYDYTPKILFSSTTPTTKAGDLLLFSTGTNKGKIKFNNSGVLTEVIPDRSCSTYQTAALWTSGNPILLSGECGYESDTKKYKIGNGTTAWNSLAYVNDNTALNSATGYQKLPSGIIIQWGITGGNMDGISMVLEKQLTIAFPNNFFAVMSNVKNIDNGTLGQTELFNCNATIISNSEINIRVRRLDGASYKGAITTSYIAIGS